MLISKFILMSSKEAEKFSWKDPRVQSSNDFEYAKLINKYYKKSSGTDLDKLNHFCKFVPRQTLSSFLVRNELFKLIQDVHGDIIEGGVFVGGGLAAFAQLSAIYEPYNHIRQIVGFDTFGGYPEFSDKDKTRFSPPHAKTGGLKADVLKDLEECFKLYDLNRPLGHIPRVELVKGDAEKTIPKYVKDNPHLVVAMLFLDFNLYSPTKAAIDNFLPRMPKGSVIAFDELSFKAFPGETLAVLDSIGLSNLRIKRFTHNPHISYAVLE
jgi:hypothetical protein